MARAAVRVVNKILSPILQCLCKKLRHEWSITTCTLLGTLQNSVARTIYTKTILSCLHTVHPRQLFHVFKIKAQDKAVFYMQHASFTPMCCFLFNIYIHSYSCTDTYIHIHFRATVGSVSCPRVLWHADQSRQQPSNLLDLLSCSKLLIIQTSIEVKVGGEYSSKHIVDSGSHR